MHRVRRLLLWLVAGIASLGSAFLVALRVDPFARAVVVAATRFAAPAWLSVDVGAVSMDPGGSLWTAPRGTPARCGGHSEPNRWACRT